MQSNVVFTSDGASFLLMAGSCDKAKLFHNLVMAYPGRTWQRVALFNRPNIGITQPSEVPAFIEEVLNSFLTYYRCIAPEVSSYNS